MIDWPTPTPYPTPDATPQLSLDPQAVMVEVADQGVGMWNTANQDGALDVVLVLLVMILVLLAFRSIQHKVQSL